MIFESKRLLELAGIQSEGESNVLTENKTLKEFSSNDNVTEKEEMEERCSEDEQQEEGDDCSEENEIREAVRKELESLWASGQVFGKKSNSQGNRVTMGFPGIGFKK